MSYNIAASSMMPDLMNPVMPAAAGTLARSAGTKASAAAAAASGSTPTSSTSPTDLGVTFLSLLATELKNQDPTAPVDSTAMVGQMISLNQLDQLISINQKTTAQKTTAAVTPSSTPPVTGQSPSAVAAAISAAITAAKGAATSALPFSPATSQLPYFNSDTLTPFGAGNAGASPAAANSPFNAPLNAATMGFSGFNTTSGGK